MARSVQVTVTIIGAGGIGATVGLALLAGGAKVEFVETDPRRIHLAHQSKLAIQTFDDWQPDKEGPIILATKCYDNAVVLDRVSDPETLLPIQNGFDSRLDSIEHRVEGIASFVASTRTDRFAPVITRPGELHVGSRGTRTMPEQIRKLFEVLRPSEGFQLHFVSNILPIKHTKLMYNAAISPLAAAAGLDNGDLLRDPHARQLFFALLQENYSILTTAGMELGKVGPFHPHTVVRILQKKWLARLLAKFFEPSLRGTYCSMAGEIEKGRTEIEHYNGYLLRLAAGRQAAPLNAAVYDLVKQMEQNHSKPDRAVLKRLAASL